MIPKSILLAEDDEDDRLFFKDFLDDRSDVFLLPPAENGMELMNALDAAMKKNSLPDLIILDQNMPKLTGMQTLKRIRQNEGYANIPVFIYSTYTTDEMVRNCMSNGASLVFSKPADKAGYSFMIDEFFKAAGI